MDFTAKHVVGYFQGDQTLDSTLTQGRLILQGFGFREHNLIFRSNTLQRGYMSLDLGNPLLAGHLQGVQVLGVDQELHVSY